MGTKEEKSRANALNALFAILGVDSDGKDGFALVLAPSGKMEFIVKVSANLKLPCSFLYLQYSKERSWSDNCLLLLICQYQCRHLLSC